MSFDNKEKKFLCSLKTRRKKYPYITRTYERSAQLREWAVLILAAFEAILRLFVRYVVN